MAFTGEHAKPQHFHRKTATYQTSPFLPPPSRHFSHVHTFALSQIPSSALGALRALGVCSLRDPGTIRRGRMVGLRVSSRLRHPRHPQCTSAKARFLSKLFWLQIRNTNIPFRRALRKFLGTIPFRKCLPACLYPCFICVSSVATAP